MLVPDVTLFSCLCFCDHNIRFSHEVAKNDSKLVCRANAKSV